MPLSFRIRWAEPTTAFVAITFTEAKSWSAALGLCASNKIAVVNSNKTEKTAKKLFLMRISFADLPEPPGAMGTTSSAELPATVDLRRIGPQETKPDSRGMSVFVRVKETGLELVGP